MSFDWGFDDLTKPHTTMKWQKHFFIIPRFSNSGKILWLCLGFKGTRLLWGHEKLDSYYYSKDEFIIESLKGNINDDVGR